MHTGADRRSDVKVCCSVIRRELYIAVAHGRQESDRWLGWGDWVVAVVIINQVCHHALELSLTSLKFFRRNWPLDLVMGREIQGVGFRSHCSVADDRRFSLSSDWCCFVENDRLIDPRANDKIFDRFVNCTKDPGPLKTNGSVIIIVRQVEPIREEIFDTL
jgi:hypothetical protein